MASCPRPPGASTTWTFRGARLAGEWLGDVDAVRCTWTPLQAGAAADGRGEPGELGAWTCEHGGRMQCRTACPTALADCRVHVHAEPPASLGAMLLLWACGVAVLAAAAVGVKRWAVRASRQRFAQLRKKNDGDGPAGAASGGIVDTVAVGLATSLFKGGGGSGGSGGYNSQHAASDPDVPEAVAYGHADVGDASSTSVYIDVDPYGPSTPPVTAPERGPYGAAAADTSRPRFARGTLGSIVGNIGDSAGSGQHDKGVGRARASGPFATSAAPVGAPFRGSAGRASAEELGAQQQQQQQQHVAAPKAAGGVLAL